MTKSKAFTLTPNRVISIDPGIERLGIAILDKKEGKEKLLYSECFRTKAKLPREERLLLIGNRLEAVIREWEPCAMAIETLFFNVNITSAIGVAESRGIALFQAAKSGLNVIEYSPQSIKLAVTGFGAADKKQMETMVRRLVGLNNEKKMLDDELDAIAVGITHLASQKDI